MRCEEFSKKQSYFFLNSLKYGTYFVCIHIKLTYYIILLFSLISSSTVIGMWQLMVNYD